MYSYFFTINICIFKVFLIEISFFHYFSLFQGMPSPKGPTPPNLLDKQLSFLPPVVFDHAPFGSKFGDVVVDANSQYKQVELFSVK